MKFRFINEKNSYQLLVDNDDVKDFDIPKLVGMFKDILKWISFHNKYNYEGLHREIRNFVEFCANSEIKEQEPYGSEDNELVSISLLRASDFRIRVFYDDATQEIFMTVNDKIDIEDTKLCCDILDKVIDEFVEHPSNNDDLFVNHMLITSMKSLVYNYGYRYIVNDKEEYVIEIL